METTTKVDRERLLQTLIANKKKHKKTYAKAMKVYRKRMAKELRQAADRVEAGKKVDIRKVTMLPEPHHYLGEYDTAIEMVEWQTEDTFELNQDDFKAFVLDKWAWRGTFRAGTSAYV
jgi:hypothetical protein